MSESYSKSKKEKGEGRKLTITLPDAAEEGQVVSIATAWGYSFAVLGVGPVVREGESDREDIERATLEELLYLMQRRRVRW